MNKMFSLPLVGLVIAMLIKEMYYLAFFFLPGGLYRVFAALGFVLIFYFFFKAKFVTLRGSMRTLYWFFILWTIFIVMRGSIIGNYLPGVVNPSLVSILTDCVRSSMTPLAFFVPLVVVVKPDLRSLYYFKRISCLIAIVFLVSIFVMRSNVFTIGGLTSGLTTLTDPNGEWLSLRKLMGSLFPASGLVTLIFLNFNYIKSKFSYLLPLALIVYLFGQIIGGARGGTFMTLVKLILGLYLIYKYPFADNQSSLLNSKIFKRIMTFIFAISFIAGLVYVYNETTIMDSLLNKTFGGRQYSGELAETKREDITTSMIMDFNESPIDWIIGRGGNGSYRDNSELSTNGRRAAMEWGFLYLILKGGIIYLIMTIIFFVRATYLGLFKSKNLLSRAMGIMCGLFLIGFASTGCEPEFSVSYLVSWMCVGWLEDYRIRYLSDDTICKYFNIKNYIPE